MGKPDRRIKFDADWREWSALPDGRRKQFIVGRALQENMPLVKKFVDRLMKRSSVYIEADDAMQAGMIGFLVAYKKYDPNRPTRFSTMLWPWVRHEVQSTMLHQTQIYRPKGTGMPYQQHDASEAFEAKNGREATAADLGCTEKELAKWKSLVFHYVPMDEIRERQTEDEGSAKQRKDYAFRDLEPLADELLEEHEYDIKVARALASLTANERRMILDGDTSFLSRADVQAFRAKALAKARKVLEHED